MAAVAISRLELSACELRQEAARTDDAPQARRLLALALGKDQGSAHFSVSRWESVKSLTYPPVSRFPAT